MMHRADDEAEDELSRDSFPRSDNVRKGRERERDSEGPKETLCQFLRGFRTKRVIHFAPRRTRGRVRRATYTSENTRLSSAKELSPPLLFFFFFLVSSSRHFAEGVLRVPPAPYSRAPQMLSIIIISILGRRVDRVVAADVPLDLRAEMPPSRGKSSAPNATMLEEDEWANRRARRV